MTASRAEFIDFRLRCIRGFDWKRITDAEKSVWHKHNDEFTRTGNLSEQAFDGLAQLYRRSQFSDWVPISYPLDTRPKLYPSERGLFRDDEANEDDYSEESSP